MIIEIPTGTDPEKIRELLAELVKSGPVEVMVPECSE